MTSQAVRVPERAPRGVTLAEVLIASALGALVLAGIATMGSNRVRMQADFARHSPILATGYLDTALALQHLQKSLAAADRVNILNADLSVQVRIPEMRANKPPTCTSCTGPAPAPCCLDDARNFRWVQYELQDTAADSDTVPELWFFDDTASASGCPKPKQLSPRVTSLRIDYMDRADLPALGGVEPFPGGEDNNILKYTMTWTGTAPGGGTALTHDFRGETALRAAVYSAVNAAGNGPLDSGSGLAEPSVSPPPVRCSAGP
ncbi:MAG: prepilin-type N-terminal cleavage/methylation domain-containing protein [Candidatus Omnitrophica bacterium]|nr:prepilin-type N-terminal cleavage/methylation domain-containing protein [Candidatus Omnitrophota bacterium]